MNKTFCIFIPKTIKLALLSPRLPTYVMYIFFYNNIGKALIYKSQCHCAYIHHFPVTRVKMTMFGRSTQLI